ncbi:Rossmann-fold NAD(P)-binding domain-containing protein [Flaviaesturariibacter terrae]
MTRTATLIGATGLIGGHLLRLLEADGYFSNIRLLVRRPFGPTGPRTGVKLLNFADAESFRLGLEGSDTVFCATGTTLQKVKKDMDAYRRVDFELPAAAARWSAAAGAKHFSLVSAIGADPQSRNFYLRLKGEAEEAARASGVPSVSVFRPSLLLGKRGERRPGERIAQATLPLLSPLLLGGLRKYRPIAAEDVARAMLADAKAPQAGFSAFDYDGMQRLLRPM